MCHVPARAVGRACRIPARARDVSHVVTTCEPLEPRVLLAVINWDGGGDGQTLTDPLNWDGDVLPGPGDDAVIDIPATPTIQHAAGAFAVNSLTVAEDFSFTGGSVDVGAPSSFSGSVTLAGGTFQGAGNLTFTSTLSWTSGAMQGSGTTFIDPAGSLSATVNLTHTLDRVLQIDGAATIDSASFVMNGGTIENNGTVTFTAFANFSSGGGSNVFTNNGTVVVNAPAGTVTFSGAAGGVAFDSPGAITVTAGTLSLEGGGTSAGTATVDAGAILAFGAAYTHGAGTSYAGAGRVRLTGGAQNFAGAITVASELEISGAGALAGAGVVSIAGTLFWNGGSMSGTGQTVIGSGGTLNMTSGQTVTLSRALRVDGAWIMSGGTLTFSAGSLTVNGTGALSGFVSVSGVAGPSSLINNGTITISGGGTSVTFSSTAPAVAFSNTATINLNAGTLDPGRGGTNSGTINVGAGATLALTANYTHAGAAYAGAGAVTSSGGTQTFTGAVTMGVAVTLSGGQWAGAGTVNITRSLAWTTGSMTGAGQTTIAFGASATLSTPGTKTLGRTFVNNGVVTHSGGSLSFIGATFTNAAGRPFSSSGVAPLISSSGTNVFTNAGTFNKSGASTLNISVRFDSSGALNVFDGIVNLDGGGTNTGPRNVAQAGTLSYRASYTHGAGSTLAGSGSVNLEGGTQTIAADWTANTFLKLVSGTLTGPGVLATSGPFFWLAGTMTGPGSILVNASGKLALSTEGSKSLARNVTNNGALHWLNGTLSMGGATITNSTGRVFAVLPAGTLDVTAGTNVINNAGTLRKMTGASLVFSGLAGGVRLNNTGLVDVRNGSLDLRGPVTQVSASTLTGGSWQVYPGTTLALPSPVSILGAGATVTKVGTSAHFTGLDDLTTNNGTIHLWRNTALTVSTDATPFINNGTLRLDRGALLAAPSDFIQNASGRLELDIQGQAPTLFPRLSIGTGATLGGTLAITFGGGFDPGAGASFQVIAAASRQGVFATTTIPALTGRTGVIEYLLTGARLVIQPG